MAQEKYVAYVGTYTHENSVGIHIYDVDVTKGYMTERQSRSKSIIHLILLYPRTENSFILLQMKVWKLSKF